MMLWCEFWFLVSTAILAFVIWRSRKKKLFKPDGIILPSKKSCSLVRFWFALLIFMGFSYFSIFPHFGSEIHINKESEVRAVRLQFHSTISDRTFESTTLSSFDFAQEIPQFAYWVLTKTDLLHQKYLAAILSF